VGRGVTAPRRRWIPPIRRRFALQVRPLILVLIVGVALTVVFVVRGQQRVQGETASAVSPTVTAPRAPRLPEASPGPAPPSAAAADDEEEREARAIDGLVAKGDIGRARAQTEAFLARHPTGPRAARLERLTGVHPHPESPTE
jgi:hypothetical protein